MTKRVIVTKTAAIVGIDAVSLSVECFVPAQRGAERGFTITGLSDTAAREARERVYGALMSLGVGLPSGCIANFSPAEVRKEGAAFDLPLAAALLSGLGKLGDPRLLADTFLFGELALDGRVLPVRAPLLLAACAAEHGARRVIVPLENVAEAALCCNQPIVGIEHLSQLHTLLTQEQNESSQQITQLRHSKRFHQDADPFSDVVGQDRAKRSLTIAAAGGHHVLLIGPPGCGKSMLAERTAQLLPPLEMHESLEAIKVHSLSGAPVRALLAGERPFRSPHYASTPAGFLGGGIPFSPGEVSLAHRGVLFLDEFPEYRRTVLEALRLPLERGTMRLSRATGLFELPARFQLIAAMNPCPCGKLGSSQPCQCTPGAQQLYRSRLSQPILDRIDLLVELNAVPISSIATAPLRQPNEGSESRRGSVIQARETALQRQGKTNHELTSEEIRRLVPLSAKGTELVERAASQFGLSARGLIRVLRVARTIADLESQDDVSTSHLAEAISYRMARIC